MAILIVTKGKGGTSRPADMTVVAPRQEMPIDSLQAIAQEAKVDGIFLADMLSAFMAHERMSVRFGLAAVQQASVAEQQELHDALTRAHGEYLTVLVELAESLGLDPLYVSPAARIAIYRDQGLLGCPLLAGSIDTATADLALMDVALALIEMGWANIQALAEIAAEARPSKLKSMLQTAAEQLDAEIAETLAHVHAARQALLVDRVLAHEKTT